MKISRHAISAVIYPSVHSNGFVSSQEVRWLTRLPTCALSIFQQCIRDHEIDMSLYHEFCGDIVAQLEKPEFEDRQDSRLLSRVNDVTICNEKNKRVRMTRYISYRCFALP